MSFLAALSALILTNVTDVSVAVTSNHLGVNFDLSGMITFPNDNDSSAFSFVDETGGMIFRNATPSWNTGLFKAGDIVRVKGKIDRNLIGKPIANCHSITFLSHAEPPRPLALSAREMFSGQADGKSVTLTGTLLETFIDEIDRRWIYTALKCEDSAVFAVMLNRQDFFAQLQALFDAEVSVTGICTPVDDGLRMMTGRMLFAASPKDFAIRRPAPADPFSVPLLPPGARIHPQTVAALGKHKIIGRVIASWDKGNALIVDSRGETHLIKTRTGDRPRHGEVIEAVGTPETDLYRINLSHAIWRNSNVSIDYDDHPTELSARDILLDKDGHRQIDPTYHGRAIRIRGTVADCDAAQAVVTLKSDEFLIPVDVSNCRELVNRARIDSKVSLAGTCVMRIGNWQAFGTFPHIDGIALVVHSPQDLVILSAPPWLTTGKLMVFIGGLTLCLVVFAAWNRWLNRLVGRRSSALLKEQMALAEAELKIGERTRLAIELHDTLSQNLSAVACQVAAAKSALALGADETRDNLQTVDRMLLSCRSELRRCLWDLRNDMFDEPNLTEIMRKVLAPVIGNAELQVRFNVSRARLDDSTLHSVICIIRELAANAVVHGKADRVAVAGDFDDGTLAFSVSENGAGFDPASCVGPAEGHFGLVGIRERVDRLGGTFTLETRPGKGSYAKVSFHLTSLDI